MVTVDLAALNLSSLAPMLILAGGALLILCLDLINKNLTKSFYVMMSVLFVLVDLGAVITYNSNPRGFFDVMLMDGIAQLSQIIILMASALFIPLALTSKRFHEFSMPEFFSLFLFMIVGFQFMVASDNLIVIFVGLETASLALYTLIALKNSTKAFEASIKYFTMGALASGFYVMGAMIFYAMSGSVEIAVIAERLADRGYDPILGLLLATVFMIGALGFKLSMIPFHTWAPDVYEGSSSALAGYMSIVPKIAGVIVAMRIFEFMIGAGITWVENVLYIIVVLTMTLSNIMALVQNDVKRMLAFSSISHAGFILAAIMINTTQANSAIFLYWFLFTFVNLGAFSMLWVSRHLEKETGEHNHPYEKFSGMIKIMPFASVIMAIFMLSLAGVPPFSLFWGKLYIMSAAVNTGETKYIILALIMGINSAISAYYYLKLIVYMFLREPGDNDGTLYHMKDTSLALKSIITIAAIATLFGIFAVNGLLEMINYYVSTSSF